MKRTVNIVVDLNNISEFMDGLSNEEKLGIVIDGPLLEDVEDIEKATVAVINSLSGKEKFVMHALIRAKSLICISYCIAKFKDSLKEVLTETINELESGKKFNVAIFLKKLRSITGNPVFDFPADAVLGSPLDISMALLCDIAMSVSNFDSKLGKKIVEKFATDLLNGRL